MDRTYIFALAAKDESNFSIKVHGNSNAQLNMFKGIAESMLGVYSPKILYKAVDDAFDQYVSKRKSGEAK